MSGSTKTGVGTATASTVVCFGEALIDMRGELVDGARRFIPQAGGAPANVAVGVARLGGKARFAGQVGNDLFGQQIRDALTAYGVDVSLLCHTDRAATALALVALDERGERQFSFYRTATADLSYSDQQLPDAALADRPIFHACSNTLTEPGISGVTGRLLARARTQGCLVSFDVNYRAPLWSEPAMAPGRILEVARQADLVKFSQEELTALYPGEESAMVASLIDAGVALVLVTDGGNPLTAHTAAGPTTLTPPVVQAVDTTAAGDAFVAGCLYQLACHGMTPAAFPGWLARSDHLPTLLAFAGRCGAVAATRFGAFDALPDLSDVNEATVDAGRG